MGITGGIGSGKTLVCSVLEKFGVPVYYADEEARRLMTTRPELIRQIKDLFGSAAYTGNTLNSYLISERVFNDDGMLNRLNEVVHPVVRKDFSAWVKEQKEAPYVVEEAAILFESGSNRHLDETVLVFAPEDLRIKRVMQRDGVDEGSIRKRMKHQMDEEEKKKLADHILINDESTMLLPQIIRLHQQIVNRK